MVGKTVHTSAAELVRYHEQHLSNGDYHLEQGKVQGEFIGALAEEWGLSGKAILKDDQRFRAFAGLDIGKRLSGQKKPRARSKIRALRDRVCVLGSKVSPCPCRRPMIG